MIFSDGKPTAFGGVFFFFTAFGILLAAATWFFRVAGNLGRGAYALSWTNSQWINYEMRDILPFVHIAVFALSIQLLLSAFLLHTTLFRKACYTILFTVLSWIIPFATFTAIVIFHRSIFT